MTAAADIHSDVRNGGLIGPRRARVDVIGLIALIVAALGLAATIVLTQTRPGERPTAPAVAATVARALPARDQWYLDHVQAPTIPPLSSQMRDRWYMDGRRATDPPKDRWYSDRAFPTR